MSVYNLSFRSFTYLGAVVDLGRYILVSLNTFLTNGIFLYVLNQLW